MDLFTKEQLATIKEQTFAYLLLEESDHCLTITLNRPKKRNALSPILVNELAYAMRYAHHNKEIWAVVLKANGSVFCAGADLKAMTGGAEEGAEVTTVPKAAGEILLGELFNKLHKPCVAQVEGNVYAGGYLLLCGCTQVVSVTGLEFGLPEVKRGLFPFQVMASMLEVMPARKVLDWCIQGYSLSVDEAKDLGLITQICTKESIVNEVNDLLKRILANSPRAIQLGLEAYDHIKKSSTEDHQYLMAMLMQTFTSKDAREGIAAFKEKRKPEWKNE